MKGTAMLSNIDKFLMGRKLEDTEPMSVALEARAIIPNLDLSTPSEHSLLAMARLFTGLRHKPGIWQMFVYELLELHGVDIQIIAREVNVSPRTIKRILASHTLQPSIKTSFKLFFLHSRLRAERYRTNEQGEVELDIH